MAKPWILITGCSSGIGRAAALTLHQRGYRVLATCRSERDRAELGKALPYVLKLDLADSDSIQQAVTQALEISEGQLSALFNNGAYGLPGAVEDLPRAALRRQFETNVFGTHELTCLVLPTLLQQPRARIVQNSSVLGLVSMPNRGAYVASKFALEGLTDTLRLELVGTSVSVSLIEPGPILSRFRDNALQAFEREIDWHNSRHQAMYQTALQRLRSKGPTMRFTLPESAVVTRLLHALEHPRPKARYYVTTPTHIMALARRVLPTFLLDRFILRFGSP